MTAAAALGFEIGAELPPGPYPGLRPFEPSEWAIFFGRETMIDEVIVRLAKQHLVLVHGASGCGKSSLVRAGVLPWLGLDFARSDKAWVTAIARPSGGPLRNIAAALAKKLGCPPSSDGSPVDATAAWHDRLALGSAALAEINRALESQDTSLCLLIDQFEELFRYAKETGREEAQLLIEILEAASNPNCPSPRVFIVLTMRSDYIGECARFDGFAETANSCQYLLPRLNDFALLRAVHEPATLYGGKIDPAVGDRLIFAARREEDALPVLQHALMRACSHACKRHGSREGWIVTLADLQAVEGEHGALSHHADEILAEITADDPMRLKAAESVFRSLAELDAEGRVVRRPCRVAELIAVAGGDSVRVTAVIDAFRAPGRNFLTINPLGLLKDDTEIDVSHEALIRRWRQLSDSTRGAASSTISSPDGRRVLTAAQDDGKTVGWLWREFEDGQRWRALAVQARVFHADKTKNATLNPATTEVYETWWPEHTPAWAARYARDKNLASEEYREVEELWHASKKVLEIRRTHLEREAQAAKKQAEIAQQLAEQRAARARGEFKTAREVLQRVRTMQGELADPFVVQQLAFATYKAQDPDAKTALLESKAILRQLNPETSSDPETVGLWAAIHKRIYDMADLPQQDRVDALSVAIWAYEKGFYLRNDYYNGINLALLLDCRAAELGGEDAIVDRVQARRARERVVGICKRLLSEGIKSTSEDRRRYEEYWIRATLVEALFGLGEVAKSEAEFAIAKRAALEPWMINVTEEQLAKVRALQQ
jgi:hypothetical protein